jgi:hypothetical protein
VMVKAVTAAKTPVGDILVLPTEQTNLTGREIVSGAVATTEKSLEMNTGTNTSSDLVDCFCPNNHSQSPVEPSPQVNTVVG